MLKLATQDDKYYIFDTILKFYDASPYRDIEHDKEKIFEVIDIYLNGRKEEYLVLIQTDNDQPIGLLVGQIIEPIFSRKKLAIELLWWLDEKHRGTRKATELIDAYEFWAKKVGASLIQLSNMESSQVDKVSRYYKHRGYKPFGHDFLKVL